MLSNPSLTSMQYMWLKVLFCTYHIDHVMVMNITWDIGSIISYLQEYGNYLESQFVMGGVEAKFMPISILNARAMKISIP